MSLNPANEPKPANELEIFDEETFVEQLEQTKDGEKASFYDKHIHIFNILRLLLMRGCMIAYSIWQTDFCACIFQTQNGSLWWLLMIPVLLIIIESLYICVFRKGVEFDW